jgi:hypothetical protein
MDETDVFDKLNIFGENEYVTLPVPLFLRNCNINPFDTPVVGRLNVIAIFEPLAKIKFGILLAVYVNVDATSINGAL